MKKKLAALLCGVMCVGAYFAVSDAKSERRMSWAI